MNLTTEQQGTATVLCPQGQINSANAREAETELLAAGEAAGQVILDLTGLDYISSAGLRVVLLLAKQLKQRGAPLVLCGMQPHVHEVFEISGFLGILNAVETRAQALAALG